jgi:UDP-N-acetylglucosamine 2-epimerase (non-hydrolysing)
VPIPESSAPRILVVIGTRPEGIKLAPVVSALASRAAEVETRVLLTGQHSTLMDQVLEVFDIPVHRDLQIMREGQSLFDVMRDGLDGLRTVLDEVHPRMIVVQGDTASAFAGGLAAFMHRSGVAHVEAGLRSGDKWRPWPEEIFRRLTDVVTDVHLAPTPLARRNLLAEGIATSTTYVTGNTVVDALLAVAARPHEPVNEALRAAVGGGHRMVLVTAHRRESFGEPLRQAFDALRRIVDVVPDVEILYPVHPNPNVREAARVLHGHDRIRVTEPLDYLDFVYAMRHASLIVTDSGGIQEEAPTFGVPVLVMRDVTERPEAVDAGVAELVGTEPQRIVEAALRHLGESGRSRSGVSPYGDGRAGERIADILIHVLTGAPRTTTDWSGQ